MSEQLWGVVVGGLIAVVPLTIQLVNDRLQHKRERQLQLRRDVYLQTADALGGSLDDFFRMTQADTPLGEQANVARAHNGWLNKIPLVAQRVETAMAFSKASAAVAAATLDILAHRVAVAEVSDDIKLVNSEMARIQAYQQQIKDLAASMERDEPTPQLVQRFEHLADQLKKTWPMLDDAAKRLDDLTNVHWARTRGLLERAITLGLNSQQLVRQAQLAAREELEMSPFEIDYIAEMDRIDREMIAKVRETLTGIENREMQMPVSGLTPASSRRAGDILGPPAEPAR
jgi:hypothetical protein